MNTESIEIYGETRTPEIDFFFMKISGNKNRNEIEVVFNMN